MQVPKELLESELAKISASHAQFAADFNAAKKAGFMEGQIELLKALIAFMAAPAPEPAPKLMLVQAEEPAADPDTNAGDQ